MSSWVEAMNSLNKEEKDLLFSIIHGEGFSSWDGAYTSNERVNSTLEFYRNLRNEISEKEGRLYNLKKEFDLLGKDKIEYIKNSGIVIDLE